MDGNFRAELLNMFRNDVEFKQLFGQGGALWEQVKALEKNHAALEKENEALKEKTRALEGEKISLQSRLSTVEGEKTSLQSRLSMVEAERTSLQSKLTTSEDRARTLEGERTSLQSRLSTVEGEKLSLQSKLTTVEGEKNSLQSKLSTVEGEKNSLRSELTAAEERASKAEADADKRLPRGWALFQKYPMLSENVRRNLDIVFRRENDFTAFISGGAQEDSLEIIWNTAQNALNNNPADAALLGDIFQYCLELVNASKAKPCYQLLQTLVGDEFDYNKHVPTGDSAAQGRIVEVQLLGYKNISNGERIMKKSIVKVM